MIVAVEIPHGSGSVEGEILGDDLELGVAAVDAAAQLLHDGVGAAGGVGGAEVGLVDDGGDGVLVVVRRQFLQQLDDVVDAEEAVDVAELSLLVGGEVGGEGAVRRAAAALVLAGGARRPGRGGDGGWWGWGRGWVFGGGHVL